MKKEEYYKKLFNDKDTKNIYLNFIKILKKQIKSEKDETKRNNIKKLLNELEK